MTTKHSNEGVVARERGNVNIMTVTVWLVLNNETHVLQDCCTWSLYLSEYSSSELYGLQYSIFC